MEPESNEKNWNDLTEAEQTAAGILGYNKNKVSVLSIVQLFRNQYFSNNYDSLRSTFEVGWECRRW